MLQEQSVLVLHHEKVFESEGWKVPTSQSCQAVAEAQQKIRTVWLATICMMLICALPGALAFRSVKYGLTTLSYDF